MKAEPKVIEGGGRKVCPGCDIEKDVDTEIGYRMCKRKLKDGRMVEQIYEQSHCKKCRSLKRVKVAETVPVGDALPKPAEAQSCEPGEDASSNGVACATTERPAGNFHAVAVGKNSIVSVSKSFATEAERDAWVSMWPQTRRETPVAIDAGKELRVLPSGKHLVYEDDQAKWEAEATPIPANVKIVISTPRGVLTEPQEKAHWTQTPVKSPSLEIVDGKPSSPWFEEKKKETQPVKLEDEYPLGCSYIYDVEVHGKPSPRRCKNFLPCGFHSTVQTREELTKLYRSEFPADKGNGSSGFRPVKFMADKLIRKLEKDSFHAGNSDLINSIGALCQK